MEDLLKRFRCENCKTRGQIELVHDAAWTSSKVISYKDSGGISYGEPEICSYYGDVWFRCEECSTPIVNKNGGRIGSTTKDLEEFLENLEKEDKE
jgi:hypothetical protein